MPDTPLNPDALEAVARERYESRRSFEDLPPWDDLLERNRKAEIRALGNRVSAYLAVAQPVVNSVEELDALPIGSAFVDVDGDTMVVTVPVASDWGTGGFRMEKFFGSDGIYYSAEDLIHSLPARVLHRPEVDE